MKDSMELGLLSKYQSFAWKTDQLDGCVILFPANRNRGEICIEAEILSKYQDFVWETGQLAGCVILFPANRNRGEVCIGTEIIDDPIFLIKSDSYVYFLVGGAGTDNPHDYYVLRDFDDPIRPAHSGELFQFGKDSFRLL